MMCASPRPEVVADFHASMPVRYREVFQGAAVEQHAAIAARRATAPAHAEVWRRLPKGGAVLCVIADDRVGLLSRISAALVANGIDVVAAQVYTRETARGPEAVDFFWLRRIGAQPSLVSEVDGVRVAETLCALVTGDVTIETVVRQAGARPAPPPGAMTRVTFDGTADADVAVLTVETFDRPGLLLAITQALSRARVQIIALEATTSRNRRVIDRFTIVELDGAPLRAERRGVLQIEVLGAVDAVARGNLQSAG